MKSTSCKEIAHQVLQRCIAGEVPKDLPRALMESACAHALFGVLVEGLADRFEPSLCDAYARLFSQAIAYATGAPVAQLISRYEFVRRPRPAAGKPHRVFVLSRVTLGADIAITSVLLAAAKRRFPHALVTLVGPQKNYELFAGDPHIHHARVEYQRGGLRERLSVWEELKPMLSAPECLVIDPDSRLTQLGLLPVCAEEYYHLFESRGYEPDSAKSLPELTAKWAGQILDVKGAKPYIALGPPPARAPYIAVSLGVGENAAKRIPDPFEEKLLTLLAETGLPICVDKGAGGPEGTRVEKAVEQSGIRATMWQGSFAGFATIIAGARLYVGYDSAGQHVASACGIPLISIFAGFPAPRMFERWRPTGADAQVIRVDRPDVEQQLGEVRDALRAHSL